MDGNLQHEDLLMKLRAKLNQGKIKLWEPPYMQPDDEITQSLKDLAIKYAAEISTDENIILEALRELQLHSIDRCKANTEFKETGLATVRVKVTTHGEKPQMLKVQIKLEAMGSELVSSVITETGLSHNRIKLIHNGKMISPSATLEQQGVKNGAQLMALIMAESPDEMLKEDSRYLAMKSTRDDAQLLSECLDDLDDDEEYMMLEDQHGKAVTLPATERRALVVALALHQRARAASAQRDHALALVLLLEADSHFSSCRSSLLQRIDNWAVLQLDVAWCYLCLRSLPSTNDAAARLAKAQEGFARIYGENYERLKTLNGTATSETVLTMRLHLLQGILAYHQNNRSEAKRLLELAEKELNALRVDESAVGALLELGWARAEARGALRAARGDVPAAQRHLAADRQRRERARLDHRKARQASLMGSCMDGSAVRASLVSALVSMGFRRRLAVAALKNSNNHVAKAVELIQEQPELLVDTDASSDDTESEESQKSEEPAVALNNELLAELVAMGYEHGAAAAALRAARNDLGAALDRLHSAEDCTTAPGPSASSAPAAPSTSTGSSQVKKKPSKGKKKKAREMALNRLKSTIKTEEDVHLDNSLTEEEEFLAQYKSLL